MNLFRALIYTIIGVCLGVFNVAVVAALPFPFFLFPIIPIFLTLAIVFRVRPTVFWCIVLAVFISDAYRASGFGVGLISLALTTWLALRFSEGLVTHRSVAGCALIGAVVGLVWALTTALFARVFDISLVGIIILVQTSATAVVVAGAYLSMPIWWKSHSPVVVRSRFI